MNNKQLRMVLLGLLGFLIFLFAAFSYWGIGQINKRGQKVVDLKLQNVVLDSQIENLVQAKKEISQYVYFKSIANSVIPNDKNQAQAVLDITRMAQESGILIQNITFPASNLGIGANKSLSSTSSLSSSSALSQAKPVSGIKGLYSLETVVTPQTGTNVPLKYQVTYAKLHDFLSRIENNRRTAQIIQVVITPLTNGTEQSPTINFTLTTNIFVKP
jgi:hypothetical protein